MNKKFKHGKYTIIATKDTISYSWISNGCFSMGKLLTRQISRGYADALAKNYKFYIHENFIPALQAFFAQEEKMKNPCLEIDYKCYSPEEEEKFNEKVEKAEKDYFGELEGEVKQIQVARTAKHIVIKPYVTKTITLPETCKWSSKLVGFELEPLVKGENFPKICQSEAGRVAHTQICKAQEAIRKQRIQQARAYVFRNYMGWPECHLSGKTLNIIANDKSHSSFIWVCDHCNIPF